MAKNNRTEEFLKLYRPKLAIMVYEANNYDYYLESHTINEKGQILEGKPLLQDTIQDIVDVFHKENQTRIRISGVIPQNLLSCKLENGGRYSMVWYRPEEVRVMHFKQELKLPVAKCWVPAMLYVLEKRDLKVFALLNDNRPTEQTILYRAPYPNVSQNGSVCLGDARLNKSKENTYEVIMKYWEDLFWLSEFTHFNGSDKILKKPVEKFWLTLLNSKTKKKWSDYDILIKSNQTIKDFI